ncbi:MAG: hypothetical protein DRO36_07120, partial [Candidatus Hecatellales archaeon]
LFSVQAPSSGTYSTTTIADYLVVDIDTLYVDPVNNRVGIGTAEPDSPLYIKSSIAGTDGTNQHIKVVDSGGTLRYRLRGTGMAEWHLNSGSADVGKIEYSTPSSHPGILLWTGSPGSYTNRWQMANKGSYMDFYWEDDGGGSSLVLRKGGNVGIGIGAPTSKLQINDFFESDNTITESQLTGLSIYTGYIGGDWGGISQFDRDGDPSTANDRDLMVYWGDDSDDNLRFVYVNYADDLPQTKMIITPSGNVGIGTTSPNYKLEVMGTASTTDVFTGQLTVATSTRNMITLQNSSGTFLSGFTASGGLLMNIASTTALTVQDGSGSNVFVVDTVQGDLEITGTFAVSTTTATSTISTGGFAVTGHTELATTTISKLNKVVVVDGIHYPQTSAGIQAAIDALPSEGGKVFLPEGTYSIDATVTIPSFITIEGAGASSTILYLADGANSTVLTNSDHTNGNTNIKISNLKIDGNDANNTGTCYGIWFYNVDYSKVENVWVYDVEDNGVYLSGSTYNNIINSYLESNNQGIALVSSSFYNNISNNKVKDNSSAGIYLNYSHRNSITGNSIYNNDYGIELYNNSNLNTVDNNVIYYNTNSQIYLGAAARENTVSNNTIYRRNSHGIELYNSYSNTIVGNVIEDNDYGVSVSVDGIYLRSSSYSNIISSNRILGNDRYGINISDVGSNSNNYLVGNYISGSWTAEISDSGINTIYGTQLVNNDLILKSSGNVGIGTTTPDHALSVVGQIYATSSSNQLILTNDLTNNAYANFSVASDGDMTIDLGTDTATTTFNENVEIAAGKDLQVDTIYAHSPLKIIGDMEVTGDMRFGGGGTMNATTTNIDNLTVNTAATFDGSLTVNGAVTLGDGGDTVAINSSDWDISATGVLTGISGITLDGNIYSTAGLLLNYASTTALVVQDGSGNNIFAVDTSSATATSTFAGGLTVDSSTLVVNANENRVGIGTVNPQ